MLQSALESKFCSDVATHTELFIDFPDGSPDVFLSTLRELQFQAHQRGVQELQYHLLQLQQFEGNTTTVENVISAYRKADPKIPERVARRHLRSLMESLASTVELDRLIAVLVCSWLPRFSPVSDNFLRVRYTCQYLCVIVRSQMSLTLSKPKKDPGANHIDTFILEFRAGGPSKYGFVMGLW